MWFDWSSKVQQSSLRFMLCHQPRFSEILLTLVNKRLQLRNLSNPRSIIIACSTQSLDLKLWINFFEPAWNELNFWATYTLIYCWWNHDILSIVRCIDLRALTGLISILTLRKLQRTLKSSWSKVWKLSNFLIISRNVTYVRFHAVSFKSTTYIRAAYLQRF